MKRTKMQQRGNVLDHGDINKIIGSDQELLLIFMPFIHVQIPYSSLFSRKCLHCFKVDVMTCMCSGHLALTMTSHRNPNL